MKNTVLALLAVAVVSCQTATPKPENTTKLGFDLANLDTSISPCSDFFQYVAGGWVEKNPIPETEPRWGKFNILIEENNEKLKYLLDSVAQETALEKGSYVQLLSDFYRSGMDSLQIEKAGLEPLQPHLSKIDNINDLDDYIQL